MKVTVRLVREVVKGRTIAELRERNSFSTESALGTAPTVVSLTSHGGRIESVHLTIESIARGRVRPQMIILWLSHEDFATRITPELRRLQARGLMVRAYRNLGPHTKYFGAVGLALEAGLSVTTADDDIIYPRNWLNKLVLASFRWPETVLCYQSRRIELNGSVIASYVDWPQNWTTAVSPRNFALGVSGVLYPRSMLRNLQRRGLGFLSVCPRADDIWLHFVALENGVPVRQITSIPTHFVEVRTAGVRPLSDSNVGLNGNDVQIGKTYSPEMVEKLRSVVGEANHG